MELPAGVSTSTYTYAGTGYANPHALTSLSNGVSTSSFSYDQNGNLIQKTTDGVTTTYVWDYANRLIALGVSGQGTTTYGYAADGTRVLQTGTSSTTINPFKWYSIASSTATGAKYSTTTEYIFNGDTLVSTIDQQMAGGVATGTAKTRYVHPDHLGSTNVVTDETGGVIETLDYYPYGTTRVSTGVDATARKYIGQFSDVSGLSYLNARYMEPTRGQFLSEEPIFLALGDANQVGQLSGQKQQEYLSDPQQLNSYSYARGNPITKKDPSGKQFYDFNGSFTVPLFGLPIGPTAGFYSTPNGGGDPYLYFGLTAALRPGPSGSVMYSPTGSPSEGWGGSISMFPSGARGAGFQVGYSQDASGRFVPSVEAGIGTPGTGVSITYTLQLSKLLYHMGGPLENVTTSMTYYSVGTLSATLPPYVVQGGTTYYRNSSGLLSSTPPISASQGGAAKPSSDGGGSAVQSSSNNGGWGNTHTACGTLCI